jgi:hypothetical protein
MSLLRRLLGKNNGASIATDQPATAVAEACQHPDLAPRWGNAADMGDYSRATTFECGVCKAQLTPAEADALEAERTG